MFVIVVEFTIDEAQVTEFLALIQQNAVRSLADEPGCRQFDVCIDPQRNGSIFLYEVYDEEAAFDEHRPSRHFHEFDEASRPMIISKSARVLKRL